MDLVSLIEMDAAHETVLSIKRIRAPVRRNPHSAQKAFA